MLRWLVVTVGDEAERLLTFASQLQEDLRLGAQIEGPTADRTDLLTQRMISDLTDAGELDDGQVCYFVARGVQVNGYSISMTDATVSLLITVFLGRIPPPTVGRTETDTALRRLAGFLGLCSRHETPPGTGDPMVDAMIADIRGALPDCSKVRFFLLTDGVTTVAERPGETINHLSVSYHLWDIRRLFRCVTSGARREPIEIDFAEFGGAIPSLEAPRTGSEYQTYLAAMPGSTLAAIYERFGARILELNVRAFLQSRGKVNQGIRATIRDSPERFLAYNNGISVTASSLQTSVLPDGARAIIKVEDFQIVNGGQTTASLFQTARKDHADLSKILVPVKISVVRPDRLRDVVPLISQYANSQNKVNNADFYANDPFHVRIEELSRSVWAPPPTGGQRQTHWFYERARGQYQDERSRARGAEFDTSYPPSQRFTKTDLAVFEQCWDQRPQLVSTGAEKNFRDFTIRLSERGRQEPDQAYFQRLVAKAILYRTIRAKVTALQLGGYRANLVAYTLAYLSNATGQRIDLEHVWADQSIGPLLDSRIADVATAIFPILTSAPGGANVTEWCKRDACWERVKAVEVPLGALDTELIDLRRAPDRVIDRGIDTPDPTDVAEIGEVTAVAATTWFAIATWAKRTGNLASWQRGLAFSIGRLLAQQRTPSWKQAHQGVLLLKEARRLGFVDGAVEDGEGGGAADA